MARAMGSMTLGTTSPGGAKHFVLFLVPPLRGYIVGCDGYPRLAPWATDLPPLRGYTILPLVRLQKSIASAKVIGQETLLNEGSNYCAGKSLFTAITIIN